MTIAFIVATVFLSSFRIAVANYDKLGALHFPFATKKFCFFADAAILVGSIYYLNWWVGLIVFALHFFSVISATLGWPFAHFYFKCFKDESIAVRNSEGVMIYAAILYVIFVVVSFFVVDYASLYHAWTLVHTIVLSSLAVVGFIVREILAHKQSGLGITKQKSHVKKNVSEKQCQKKLSSEATPAMHRQNEKRLNDYAAILIPENTPITELAIVTVASCDPKFDRNEAFLYCSNLSTIIDTICFTAFINRFLIFSESEDYEYQNNTFSFLYFYYLGKLVSYAFSISKDTADQYIDNRMQIYESACYDLPDSSKVGTAFETFVSLLRVDLYSDVFIERNDEDFFPLLDATDEFQIHLSANAYLNSFPTVFNNSIRRCRAYLPNL